MCKYSIDKQHEKLDNIEDNQKGINIHLDVIYVCYSKIN